MIARAVADGRLTARDGELLAGYVLLRDAGILPPVRRTRFRRLAALRRLGIEP